MNYCENQKLHEKIDRKKKRTKTHKSKIAQARQPRLNTNVTLKKEIRDSATIFSTKNTHARGNLILKSKTTRKNALGATIQIHTKIQRNAKSHWHSDLFKKHHGHT